MSDIASLATNAARRFGRRGAILFPGERLLSFHDIENLAGRFARGLASQGIGQGDRVVLCLPNCWRWIIAYHAIARLGAVVVPANILLSDAEIDYITSDSGAKALIVEAARLERLDRGLARPISVGAVEGTALFDDLLDREWQAAVDVAPVDLFTIGYTSGTTGRPKGAMLTHGGIFASVAGTATIHERCESDRIYSALPLSHVYGNVVMNTVLHTGAWLASAPRFDARDALQAIADHRITLFEGVPTMYYQMLGDPSLDAAELGSLRKCTVGGQSMPTPMIEKVRARFGCPMLELWGMTELGGPATSHAPSWEPRLGSIGKPFPQTEVRIASLEDPAREAALGEAGELMVRGPLVMQGYWQREDASADTIRDGWLATGDIATLDAAGYVTIVDRLKDMIITAGYNVYPAELEQAIASHPAIMMAAVGGIPDEEKGELAHAFVVLRPGSDLTASELVEHCRSKLAAYKIPRAVHFVDDLPKTSTGKIMRRALRELVAATVNERMRP